MSKSNFPQCIEVKTKVNQITKWKYDTRHSTSEEDFDFFFFFLQCMNMNQTGKIKLDKQNFLQQEKHVKLYTDLLQT